MKQTNITQSQIRELYFPFSLRDSARDWINDLDKTALGITDWDSLALAFYKRYFPTEKTNSLRSQITGFKQSGTEDLHEAWERYKKLLRGCPHHGFETWFVILQFHNGLYNESRAILDSAAGGRFTENVDDDKAWQLIEDMAVHTAQYGNTRGGIRRISGTTASVSATDAKLDALLARIDKMELHGSSNSQQVNVMAEPEIKCDGCGVQGHSFEYCMAPPETVNAFQAYKNSPYMNQPGADRSMLSYASQNVLNPTPPPVRQPYVPPHRNYQPNTYVPRAPFVPHSQPASSTDPMATIQNAMIQMQQTNLLTQKNHADQMAQMQRDAKARDDQITALMAHTKKIET